MSRVFVTSDLHRGHRNIHKYRPFASAEEHDEFVKEQYYSVVTKRDTVMFLGDVAFTSEALEEISKWPGYKVLILGNHDVERLNFSLLTQTYNKVYSLHNKKGCWLSHAPIHPVELRGKFCVHGHMHSNVIPDGRYRNVCLEHTEYKPILFEDVVKELRSKNAENI